MKAARYTGLIAFAVAALIAGACKSSGMALSSEGHIMKIAIDVRDDLSDGETRELLVRVANRGVNKLQDVTLEVEIPRDMVVISQVKTAGNVTLTQREMASDEKVYSYDAKDIPVGAEAEIRYHVRSALVPSGVSTSDIRVIARSRDLPGGQLVETKSVKLR